MEGEGAGGSEDCDGHLNRNSTERLGLPEKPAFKSRAKTHLKSKMRWLMKSRSNIAE